MVDQGAHAMLCKTGVLHIPPIGITYNYAIFDIHREDVDMSNVIYLYAQVHTDIPSFVMR